MSLLIENAYFEWLIEQIDFGKPTGKTYLDLLGQLHSKEFVWIVPNDDNRLEDAMALRHHFVNHNHLTNTGELLIGVPPLSVLEVIIGLSHRCAFAGGGTPEYWAWQLVKNLELDRFHDQVSPSKQEEIDGILDTLIYRNYEADGVGGFFPLTHPKDNQTKVEIWYQMNAYLDELEQ